jgi:putative peptidoglycan lipid II flippase
MNKTESLTSVESQPTAQPALAGSATLLAIGSATSRIFGLAREVMITSLFGATGEVSAFRLASQVPVLLYDFLIGGMLSAALVPVLSQYIQVRGRGEFAKLIMFWGMWRAGLRLKLHLDWRHPSLAQIVRLYVPIAAGILVSLFQVGLDRRLATGTQPESVAWMSNATTLQQMPLGLISIAISLAALPRLSQYFAQGDEDSYRATLGRGLRMVLLLIVPAAVLLWTLGEPVIRILFQRNRFTPADTLQVSAALNIYIVGMLFAAIDYPLNLAFYARQNTRLPALVGVVSVGFYILTAWALLGPLGYLGLVWADTAKQAGHMLIMIALISWQVGMRRELLGQGVLWILLAGLAAGIVTWVVTLAVNPIMHAGLLHDLMLVVVAGGAGVGVYALLLQWLRLPEFEMVNGWFWQRLGRSRA